MQKITNKDLPQQVLFTNDLGKRIGRNRLTFMRWWMEGKLPVPVKLNGTTLAWHYATINAWINQHFQNTIDNH